MLLNTADEVQELRSSLIRNLHKSQSIYDAVAACYSLLLDAFGNDDNIAFISEIDNMTFNEGNSDVAKKYHTFRAIVVELTSKIEISRDTDCIEVKGFLNRLLDELRLFSCPDGVDEIKHLAFCAFYIIGAIDTYVVSYVISKRYERSNLHDFGPLNKSTCLEKCAVYFQEGGSILENAYNENSSENPFRKQIHDVWWGNVFNGLLIIPVNRFNGGIPKVIPVTASLKCRAFLSKNKMLRIADIPFIGFDTFDFYETDTHKVCGCGEIPNGTFSVKYYSDDRKNIEHILKLLDLAIKDKANIIVFPEFVLSEKMLDAVKERLAEIDGPDKLHLMMVFAGTGCELNNGDKEGNNILHILSPGGYEMGRYYKYSPYNTRNDERPHGGILHTSTEVDKQSEKDMPYFKNCELLSSPGKECCLFDVEFIGRVLPAVCRDVIDGKYTDNLIGLFLPTLLLVPSWSQSLSGFVTRFSGYAKTVHTSSLLCNCCNAIKHGEKSIGNFVYPVKEDKDMQYNVLSIERVPKCLEKTLKCRGCARRIDIDFSGGKLNVTQEVLFPDEKSYLC